MYKMLGSVECQEPGEDFLISKSYEMYLHFVLLDLIRQSEVFLLSELTAAMSRPKLTNINNNSSQK